MDFRKVLVVDDDKLLAYIVQAILEGEGYEVKTAADGEEGYWIFLVFRPEIVVADIWMPHKGGLEMMEQIRIQRPEVRAIYMSGELDRAGSRLEEERRRFQVGVLRKPFSRDELMRQIFQLSNQRQSAEK